MNALDERIRSLIESSARPVTVDEVAERRVMQEPGPVTPRPRLIAAAAVLLIAAAGVVGVAVVAGRDADQNPADPPTTSQPAIDPTTTSPSEIDGALTVDLDEWTAGATPEPPQRFTVLDLDRLPAGYVVDDAFGATTLDSSSAGDAPDRPDGYRWMAALYVDEGPRLGVAIERQADRTCSQRLDPGASEVEIAGRPALADLVPDPGTALERSATAVCWQPEQDTIVVLDAAVPVDLVAVAESLVLTDTTTLPYPDPNPVQFGLHDAPTFRGVLNGLAWTANVNAGPLRAMSVRTEAGHAGAFGHDRQSQPEDLPAAHIEGHIAGVPGFGAILYGVGPQGAVGVVVTDTVGRQETLPIHIRELETFFAIPIPDAVQIESIEFVDLDGTSIAQATVPRTPVGLGGSSGGDILDR